MKNSILYSTGAGAALLAAAVTLSTTCSVQAINNGSEDVNNDFANVGAIVFMHPTRNIPWEYCSGTLIHERGFLTAAHCTEGLENLIANGRLTMDDIHVSFSPDDALNPATWMPIKGIYTHPDYGPFLERNTYDVALLELAVPITHIQPAQLAPVGFLDDLEAEGILHRKYRNEFVVVGYGDQREFPERVYTDPMGRRFWAVGEFQTLRPYTLQLNMVQAPGIGAGGTCYGDSGGPAFYFLNDGTPLLTSVTSWGDYECVATDFRYRVDTELAHSFIAAVLHLIDNP